MEAFSGQPIYKKDLQNKKIRIVYPSHSKFFKGAGFYEGEYKGDNEPIGSGIFIAAQPFWKEVSYENGLKHGVHRLFICSAIIFLVYLHISSHLIVTIS